MDTRKYILDLCEHFTTGEYPIPYDMAVSLANYVVLGWPVGGFLSAVLSNDLYGATRAADLRNQKLLYNYIFVLYNQTPRECWGSPDNYRNWQKLGGLQGKLNAPAQEQPEEE